MGHGGLFSLTSPVVVHGFAALAAAAVLVDAVGIPVLVRQEGLPTLGAVIVQSCTVVLCIALTMTAVGLAINRQFGLYPSWADLLDGAGSARIVDVSGAPADLAAPLIGAGPGPTALQADPRSSPALAPTVRETLQGQWITVTVPGVRSDVTERVRIHLPAGYLQHPHRRYPVLMAFSGIPGSPAVFSRALPLDRDLATLAQRARIREAIVVAPVVYPGRHDTECVDRADGTHRYETWIAEDITAWVRTHLRPIEDPEAWATLGYSAGGWCAAMIAVRHPDVARSAISFAGYFI